MYKSQNKYAPKTKSMFYYPWVNLLHGLRGQNTGNIRSLNSVWRLSKAPPFKDQVFSPIQPHADHVTNNNIPLTSDNLF